MEKTWTAIVEFTGERALIPKEEMRAIAQARFPSMAVFKRADGSTVWDMRSQNGSLKDGFCVCLIRKDPNNPALHSGDLAAYGPTVQG